MGNKKTGFIILAMALGFSMSALIIRLHPLR